MTSPRPRRAKRAGGGLTPVRLGPKTVPAAVTLNDAKVTTADIAARNGVIHVIDTVVLPK
jgi:uncharacterized surface protein with fasciclin (FAS1) repeats